ncbi:MAG TPA: hypothetical protein VME41_01140 [Stellaceae bacterium]|nr:hypothetical protein [Stellaceae bacterium]
MMWKRITLSAAVAATLALAPLAGAQARPWGWHGRGWGFWPFWAGAAVAGTAAAVATAPLWAYPRYYYYPPAAYYPPPPAYYGYYPYYRY